MAKLAAAALLLLAAAVAAATVTPEELQARLDAYVAQVDRQITVLDSFLDTYYKDYNFTEEDAKEYVSNPINTYMLIKRTGVEWPKVKAIIFNDTLDREFEEIQRLTDELNLVKDDQQKP